MICCFNNVCLHNLLQWKTSGNHEFVPRKLWPRMHLLLVINGFFFIHLFLIFFLNIFYTHTHYSLIAKKTYRWLRVFIQIIGSYPVMHHLLLKSHTSSRKDGNIIKKMHLLLWEISYVPICYSMEPCSAHTGVWSS